MGCILQETAIQDYRHCRYFVLAQAEMVTQQGSTLEAPVLGGWGSFFSFPKVGRKVQG
jgi:hypothetical protein